ncbi:MAG: hypothetical protein ACPGU5_00585 [Lishizhenia sp.]
MDVQVKLFEQIKAKLPAEEHLGKVLSELLEMSTDSVYRRLRGETSLTPEEIQLLCNHFEVSFDKIMGTTGQSVIFHYNPIKRSEFSFTQYLEGINYAFTRMLSQKYKKLHMNYVEVNLFQLLHFPMLLKFKLVYFTKFYLNLPQMKEVKFSGDWTGGIPQSLFNDTLVKYVKIPSEEVMDFENCKGLVREIVNAYEMDMIASKEDALDLLNETEKMFKHFIAQVTLSKKFIYGTDPSQIEENYDVYVHPNYVPDNTVIADTNAYRLLYITHNMLNYLYSSDIEYVSKTFSVYTAMVKTCKKISSENASTRNAYSREILAFIDKARMRLEGVEML